MTENNLQKKPYPLGAHIEDGGVRFSFVCKSASCGIMLYDKATGREMEKIIFSQQDRIGNVYCRLVRNIDTKRFTYHFIEEGHLVPDERARFFPGKVSYGKERTIEDLKAGFPPEEFDWGQDCFPRLRYHEVIGYCLHVRGFTKHASSQVKNRGTFAGILEKIPYLKEIGITTIELQPAYEFTEIPTKEERKKSLPTSLTPGEPDALRGPKLNYWGYKKGYYYVPKAAYAASDDPVTEFKSLVKALHANHLEVIMQFYFPESVSRSEIPDILRFWVTEYHVDGFHLMGENLPADLLASDDMLADTKLWYYQFDTGVIYARNELPRYPHVAEYNDAWYYCMRGFLKGDGNVLGNVLYHMRHIPEKAGNIHYMTNYYGFTLADLVSYNHKHNEANGEENRDGNDHNCSWNCGEEGPTRRQTVKKLREKQMKNAMCMILLSQSTPLIFMGDEFGNSQKGNNNPYCQDNGVVWLDWRGISKNAGIFSFWKMLVDFRTKHPILHPEKELRLMDYIACGYPDLSYHGQNAWSPQMDGNSRSIGCMFCGKYAKSAYVREDSFLYLAVNMHWENRSLAFPKLPKGMKWDMVFTTDMEGMGKLGMEDGGNLLRKMSSRSITVYMGVPAKGGETSEESEAGEEEPLRNGEGVERRELSPESEAEEAGELAQSEEEVEKGNCPSELKKEGELTRSAESAEGAKHE